MYGILVSPTHWPTMFPVGEIDHWNVIGVNKMDNPNHADESASSPL
jgi:hypothetical protein